MAQDRSRVELEACTIKDCQGPALDLTRHAQASVMDCSLGNCSGSPCTHLSVQPHRI